LKAGSAFIEVSVVKGGQAATAGAPRNLLLSAFIRVHLRLPPLGL
jgi:hypothetical protein